MTLAPIPAPLVASCDPEPPSIPPPIVDAASPAITSSGMFALLARDTRSACCCLIISWRVPLGARPMASPMPTVHPRAESAAVSMKCWSDPSGRTPDFSATVRPDKPGIIPMAVATFSETVFFRAPESPLFPKAGMAFAYIRSRSRCAFSNGDRLPSSAGLAPYIVSNRSSSGSFGSADP